MHHYKLLRDVFYASLAVMVVQTAIGQSLTTLVPTGSTWKYLDDGSNQGTAWVAPEFDDSGWGEGPAQLGYGDGDEATLVTFGPSAANKYPTTYFRHTFSVADASDYIGLRIRLLRDDGAAVYVNGQELVRDNLFAGAAYNTYAITFVGGDEENLFYEYGQLPAEALVDGENVLAVEIHQSDATSSDVSFDLELTGVLLPASGGNVIDFDDVDAPCGFGSTPQLSAEYEGLGVLFEGPQDPSGGVILNACGNFGVTGYSGSNFLAFNVTGVSTVTETIWFADPVGTVSLQAGSSSAGNITLRAFDQGGTELDQVTRPLSTALTTWEVNGEGIVRVVVESTATVFVLDDLSFASAPVLVNGSFETGDFTGWIVQDITTPYYPLQVLPNGNSPVGFFATFATDGIYSAVHGFDGGGPATIRLSQDVNIPPSRAMLEFDYRAGWSLSGLPRLLNVVVQPAGGGVTLFTTNILTATADMNTTDTGSRLAMVNLAAFAGNTVRLSLDAYIPENFTGPGFMQLDNVRLEAGAPPPVEAPPVITVQPLGQNGYVGGSVTFSVLATGTPPFTYAWELNGQILDGATQSFLTLTNLTMDDAGTYRVQVSNAFGSALSDKATLVVEEVPPRAIYLRSQVGTPYGTMSNEALMEQVFGLNGWDDARFETVDPSFVFAPNRPVIFMDGSDNGAQEMEDFLNANRARMEAWVTAGGSIFLNASPNEGDGMSMGFGVNLFYGDFADSAVAVSANHPMLLGPYLPVGTQWQGFSFSHASVSGSGLLPILINPFSESFILAEKSFGAGHVLVGGMNPVDFHSPNPEASNLRANMLAYCLALYAPANDTPPQFLSQPLDVSLLEGRTLVLNSLAIGSRPITYQWYKDGDLLGGATESLLVSSNVVVAQSGSYQVVASNPFGTVTSQVAQVTIRAPIAVAGHYFDSRFGNYRDLTPFLEAAGFLAPPIPDISTANLDDFDIIFVTADGYGVTSPLFNRLNDLEDWVERGGRLIIHDPLWTQPNAAQTYPLLVGAPVTEVIGDDGSFNIDLLIPGGAPLINGPYGMLNNTSLDYSDGGTWSHGGYVTLASVPRNVTTMMSQGASATRLVGISYGHNQGAVFFGTLDLLNTLDSSDQNMERNVRDIYLPNLTSYMFQRTSQGAPVIGVQPQDTKKFVDGNARMTVTASGSLPLTFQWYKDGAPIPGATGPTLSQTSVSADDSGIYHVVVSNTEGTVTSAEASLEVVSLGRAFRILELTDQNSAVIDHNNASGDDRGPIAVGAVNMYYAGDSGTAAINLDDISQVTRVGSTVDGLVSDLETEQVYIFGNGSQLITSFASVPATSLLGVNEATGAVDPSLRIDLSMPILLREGGSQSGIFAGYGRILIHTGSRVYNISLPSGAVLDLGPMNEPSHTFSEAWAYWGVAEFFDGSLYMVYAQDFRNIVRTRVPDGETTTVATFSNLSDMASFSVSIPRNRWYFHHEGGSQFGGSAETAGYATALFDVELPDSPPRIVVHPRSLAVAPGSDLRLRVLAIGSPPLSYQWIKDGAPLPGATDTQLLLDDVTAGDGGLYEVSVTNPFGTTVSEPAMIDVDPSGALVFTGYDYSFAKPNQADWTLPQNQDRLTDAVWLTRQNNQGLFNIVTEDFFSRPDSPMDTEWAFGTADNWANLTFRSWVNWHGNNPPSALNRPAVLHLISENIYLDIMMTSWSSQGQGGFAYNRAFFELPEGEPVIRSQPRDVTVGPNSDVVFEVFAIGLQPFTYQWTYEGAPIPGATERVLLVDNVGFNDQGAYAVTVSNGLGSTTSQPGILTVDNDAPRIFTGYEFTFTKANNADPNLPANQDRISDNVWLTRQSSQGIYNIHTEPFFTRFSSPDDTEWADGQAGDWASLQFRPWIQWVNGNPPSSVNRSAVLHLISENVYLDIRFTQWTSGGQGGGFQYQRALIVRSEPVIRGLNRQQIGLEDRSTAPLAFTVVDESTPGDALVFSATSDNPSVIRGEDVIVTRVAGSLTNFTVVATPQPDAEGNANCTVFATDLDGNVGVGEINYRINGINDPPVFVPGTNVVVLNDAGPVSLPDWAEVISPGPSFEASQTLTVMITNLAPALFAQVPALSTNGTLSFEPAPGAVGEAVVIVSLRDSGSTSLGGRNTNSPVSFTITIVSANAAPAVADAAFEGIEDIGASGDLMGVDPDGDPLSFRLEVAPSLGVAMVQPSGHFTYTPPANYSGMVPFIVVANDGAVDSPPATITIHVAPVNDPPSFQAGAPLTLLEDAGPQSWPGWATGMSAGPDDEADQTLQFELEIDDPSLFLDGPSLSPDGTLTLTPGEDASGTANLTLRLRDSGGAEQGGVDASPAQVVAITILPVNDAPSFTAGADLVVLEDAGAVTFPGWATSIRVGPDRELAEGQTASFEVAVDDPSLILEGPLLTPSGDLSFVPAADANGTVQLTITLRDTGGTANGGQDQSAVQTASLTIKPVNDAPGFVGGGDVVVSEDAGPQSRPGWASAIKAGPDNESTQAFHFVVETDQAALFSAVPAISSQGTLSFTPAANEHGSATVTVRLLDDGGTADGGAEASPAQTFRLTVDAVNDRPTARSIEVDVEEDGQVLITLAGEDADGDPLQYEILSGPAHGTLSPGGSDSWTYQPAADYHGADRFTYRALDAELASDPAEVLIRVDDVNDAPLPVMEVGPLADLVPGGEALLILSPDNVQAAVRLDGSQTTDPEGDPLTFSWYEPGDLLPFAGGDVVEVSMEIGLHEVILVVDDGKNTASASVIFEVISGGQGVELLIMQVDESAIAANRKRPLIATLKAAAASFDRGSLGSGVNQLQAFQNKVSAQVAKEDPALAAFLIRNAQLLIDTLTGP